MRKAFNTIITGLLICFSLPSFAQNNGAIYEQIISWVNDNIDYDYDREDIRDLIDQYLQKPLNINSPNRTEIEDFPFFTPKQKESILDHLKQYGGFVDLNELKILPGFTSSIEVIFPLLRLRPVKMTIMKNQSHRLLIGSDIHLHQNHDNIAYVAQYKFQLKNGLSGGFCFQHDREDGFYRSDNIGLNNNLYFDHFVFNLSYNNEHRTINKVILGTYRLKLGQGLLFWNGFTLDKSSYTTMVEKNAKTLSGFQSTNEWDYLKGIASEVRISKHLRMTSYFSYKEREGKYYQDKASFSLDESGVNPNQETTDYNGELIAGSQLKLSTLNFELGIIGNYTHYEDSINPVNFNYQKVRFSGKELIHTGLNHTIRLDKIRIWGEAMLQNKNQLSFIQGLNFSPTASFTLSSHYRRYRPNYFSSYSNAFKEGSEAQNEEAFYVGSKISFSRTFQLDVFADWFKTFSPSYRFDSPSKGVHFLVQGNILTSNESVLSLRFENKQLTARGAQKISTANRYRVQYTNPLSDRFTLRTRVEVKTYHETDENYLGSMVFQELRYTPSYAVSFAYRIAFAQIEDFDVRIYTQDLDVPLSYTNSQFSRNAWYQFFRVRFKVLNGLNLWMKIGLRYEPNTIDKNEKYNEQLKIRLTYDI